MDEDDYGPVADDVGGAADDDGLGSLIAALSSIGTSDPDELVRQWSAIMAVSAEEAHFFLAAAQFKLEAAISLYLDARAGASAGARHAGRRGGGAVGGGSGSVGNGASAPADGDGGGAMLSPGADSSDEGSPIDGMLVPSDAMRREQEALLAAAAASGRRETAEERFQTQLQIAMALSMAGAAAPSAEASVAAGSSVPTEGFVALSAGVPAPVAAANAGQLLPAPPPAPPGDSMLE